MSKTISRYVAMVAMIFVSTQIAVAQYDPLAVPENFKSKSIELSVEAAGQARQVPLRIDLPESEKPAPVVLFSHGLGGSRDINRIMGNHWAARGYVAVFLQHPGSDTSVWKDVPPRERMKAMREAASTKNLLLRCDDVQATLDQLELWNQTAGHPLHGRLDPQHTGMSGHSFGAHTTQAVAGQKFPFGQNRIESRIEAAIAFSPSSPARGSKSQAFGSVKVPWMLMTGTNDVAPVGDQSVKSRLEVYPNLPNTINKFELVLKDAEHSAFADRALPGEKTTRNPNHQRAILALSTAFWDAYLKNDAAAHDWLKSGEVRKVLEEGDRWQSNFAK